MLCSCDHSSSRLMRVFRLFFVILMLATLSPSVAQGAVSRAELREDLFRFTGRYIDRMTEAFDALERVRSPWRLLVVGSGEERATFATEIRTRGWEDRVEIREGVPHADVPTVMRRMSVLVVPSLLFTRAAPPRAIAVPGATACPSADTSPAINIHAAPGGTSQVLPPSTCAR